LKQLRRRGFDLIVTVLMGAGFHRKQSASMNISEIAKRELVSRFAI